MLDGVWQFDDGGPSTCVVDPYAANRTFFLRGQGANGAKPATDETGKALTWSGGAFISTYGDPAPYGSSVALDGTGYIRSTGNPAAFGTGNFTVRMRAAIDAAPVTDTALVRVSNTGELSLRRDTAGSPKLELAATGVGVFASASFSPTIGTVYDIEVTRVSGVSYIFINGVLTASAACTHSFVAGDLDIGLNGSVRLYAHMTDILLYSVGLHSSSFTPTTLPLC